MTAFTGRDLVVEFAIAKEDVLPGTLVYQRLGMMRGKEMKTSWDTADTTADMSPSFTKTSLVTFKGVEFSGDGVTYTDAAFNQQAFKVQAISPSAATDNQPKVWLRMTDPTGAFWEGPFIVTEWSDSGSYSDAVTWSMSASSNGNVVFTPA